MTQAAPKWKGKSTYQLRLRLDEISKNTRALYQMQQVIQEANRRLNKKAAELVLDIMGIPANDTEYIVFGGWECPDSPTEHCIYNTYEDPMKDFCLVCGDPSERK